MRPIPCAPCVLCAVIAITSGGCSPTTVSFYHDALPPPEDPLVLEGEVGAYGGRFAVVGTGTPDSFNPVMGTGVPTLELCAQLFVRLARLDGVTQQLVPLLAKSWEASADGRTWTFHLRRDVRFSDGHPLTAEDVIFSFDAIFDERVAAPRRSRLTTKGTAWKVTALDASTVAVLTPEPSAIVPDVVSNVFIMPKHVLEPSLQNGTFSSAYALTTPPEQVVTSGPWQVRAYTRDRAVLIRNPYWFGIDTAGHRLPYLDELVIVDTPDQNAAHLKFEVGEVDALPLALPENFGWYETHQRDGRFTLYEVGPSPSLQFFWFNLNRVRRAAPGKPMGTPHVDLKKYAWFNNRVFRRAVSLAIDRDAMIKSVFYGDGVKNWSSATLGNKQWHTPDLVHDDYNPAEARRLLAELGWRDRDEDGTLEDPAGQSVAFSLKTNSNNLLRLAMANFIRDDLAKVGIRVTLAPTEFNTLVTNLSRDYQYDAALIGVQTDPDVSQHTLWRSSDLLHPWHNFQSAPDTAEEARIDALMDRVAATLDVAERRAMWKEIQTIINEQAWVIWLPIQVIKIPVRNRIGNMRPTSMLTGVTGVAWNAEQLYVRSGR